MVIRLKTREQNLWYFVETTEIIIIRKLIRWFVKDLTDFEEMFSFREI